MEHGYQYGVKVAAYLAPIAAMMEARGDSYWATDTTADLASLEKTCAPLVDELRKFIKSKENAGAVPGFGSYEERLVNVRQVAANWFSQGDRAANKGSERLTKPQWLEQNPQTLRPASPGTLALWIYANDIDWTKTDGPEHLVTARGKGGKPVVLDKIGRPGRDGNRKTLAFVIPGIDPSKLALNPLEILIENSPGGPYSSTIYALYLMPDAGESEDEATRQIQKELESVRRRAAGFVEFKKTGEPSTEKQPAQAKLSIPGYPEESFRK
jgi:hypothetical protein